MAPARPNIGSLRHSRVRRVSTPTDIASGRLRVVLGLILGFAYLAILYVGPDIFLPAQGNDAKSVAVLSTSVDEVNSFDGYAAMAFIYRYTTLQTRYLILILIAAAYFWSWIRYVNSAVCGSIVLFLCIAPILLSLCFFVKDTVYIAFMVVAAVSLRYIRSNVLAAMAVCALYCLYAIIFRQYFFLISAAFAGIMIFRRSPVTIKIIIIICTLLIMYFLPESIYKDLHDARDLVNRFRIGVSGSGYRTAFVNLVPADGLFNFLTNFGYAIIRLNFPVIFTPTPKEILLTANVLVLGYLTVVGLSSNDRRIWRPASLFVAHFLVLMIFEPDYGSYLRHIMTSAPLLGPALLMLGSKKDARREPISRQGSAIA
jgi:hypothetical protein